MTAEEQAQREATDQAAARAEALVASMYALELAGRPLTRRQRDQQLKAERWARFLQRQATKEGRHE